MKELKEIWIVDGVMPERAIDKLQKSGISVFSAKKIKKTQILFHIMKKDIEKAFAIYPNMCYNNIRGSVYTFTRVGALTPRERVTRRFRLLGILLGVCCFLIAVLGSTDLVFKIEVVGSKVYEREVVEILKENGVGVFSGYKSGKEKEISAQILALDGVEFCSVKKSGNRVIIEVRQTPLPQIKIEEGDLIAPRSCRLEKAVALGGTILKKAGEEITAGESIVGGFFMNLDGVSQSPTTVVATAKLLCVEEITARSEEEGRAQAILLVESLGGKVGVITIENEGESVKARVEFTLVVKKNM